MARKPSDQPATAWDYRRAIELVQVLAIEAPVERWKALYALADAWGMNGYGDPAGTLHWLATHALADARADGAGDARNNAPFANNG